MEVIMDTFIIEPIREKIYRLRDTEVMIDSDIAELYGVETKRINEAVKNNPEKFPDDFMLELADDEFENLRSKISTSSWGGRRHLPKAFTEQGVYMLATVLKSQRATDVTISIMRTFSKIRRYALEHGELLQQIHELKKETAKHKEWTKDKLTAVADTIIMLEDSLGALEEMILEIKSAKEVETIGFLRGKEKAF
jgi:hypothetical protein